MKGFFLRAAGVAWLIMFLSGVDSRAYAEEHVHSDSCYDGHRHSKGCITKTGNFGTGFKVRPGGVEEQPANCSVTSFYIAEIFEDRELFRMLFFDYSYDDGTRLTDPCDYFAVNYHTINEDNSYSWNAAIYSRYLLSSIPKPGYSYSSSRDIYYMQNPQWNTWVQEYQNATTYLNSKRYEFTSSLIPFKIPGTGKYFIGSHYAGYGNAEFIPVDYYICGLSQDETVECDKVVTSITPLYPSQTIYKGTLLDVKATATYLDGHKAIISLVASEYNNMLPGTQSVTLTYSGLINDVKTFGSLYTYVDVLIMPDIASLSVVASKATIYKGETINFTVTVIYEDGSSQTLSDGMYEKSGFNPNKAGIQTVAFAVTENDKTVSTSINITVLDLLASISASVDRSVLYNGDPVPIFTVTAFYANGQDKVIFNGPHAAFKTNRIGSQTIPFSYTENEITKQAFVTVVVKPNLTGIEASITSPVIYVGQEINLKVKANYEDGSFKSLEAGEFASSGADNTSPGKKIITVSYTENVRTYDDSIELMVLEPGFNAYVSPPVIELTSNSVGSNIIFYSDSYNAEIIDIWYSVDGSGYFSSNRSGLKALAGKHTVKAKTRWKKLLDTVELWTEESVLIYDISIDKTIINAPNISFNEGNNTVTITNNGAVNTVVKRLEYSIGVLQGGEYQFQNRVYQKPFVIPAGEYIIKAWAIDTKENSSSISEISIANLITVGTPLINYSNTARQLTFRSTYCRNSEFEAIFYNIDDSIWQRYSDWEVINLPEGYHMIKAYSTAVAGGDTYYSDESAMGITVVLPTPSPTPSPISPGGSSKAGIYGSMFVICLFLLSLVVWQKVK